MSRYKEILEYFILISIISYGIYLCGVNNYGWDWDTYAMFDTFLKLKEEGIYQKSRGAGYLLPEIGISFLAFYLGSFFVNLVCFIFLIIGLFFFILLDQKF